MSEHSSVETTQDEERKQQKVFFARCGTGGSLAKLRGSEKGV